MIEVSVTQLPDCYNFLKTYKIDNDNGAKEKVEYSYVLTKGTHYIINVCESGNPQTTVTIFDRDRNKVASNLISGQKLRSLEILCNATGIYYLVYSFNDTEGHCGASSLGFRRVD